MHVKNLMGGLRPGISEEVAVISDILPLDAEGRGTKMMTQPRQITSSSPFVPCLVPSLFFAVESLPVLALEALAEHGATQHGQFSSGGRSGGDPNIIIAHPTNPGGEAVASERGNGLSPRMASARLVDKVSR